MARTTVVTMAYIVVVNPQILAQAGMPVDGVVFATVGLVGGGGDAGDGTCTRITRSRWHRECR